MWDLNKLRFTYLSDTIDRVSSRNAAGEQFCLTKVEDTATCRWQELKW